MNTGSDYTRNVVKSRSGTMNMVGRDAADSPEQFNDWLDSDTVERTLKERI